MGCDDFLQMCRRDLLRGYIDRAMGHPNATMADFLPRLSMALRTLACHNVSMEPRRACENALDLLELPHDPPRTLLQPASLDGLPVRAAGRARAAQTPGQRRGHRAPPPHGLWGVRHRHGVGTLVRAGRGFGQAHPHDPRKSYGGVGQEPPGCGAALSRKASPSASELLPALTEGPEQKGLVDAMGKTEYRSPTLTYSYLLLPTLTLAVHSTGRGPACSTRAIREGPSRQAP